MKDKTEYFDLEKSTVLKAVSNNINSKILSEYELVNIIPNGGKFILKWDKRIIPLTIEEVEDLYK